MDITDPATLQKLGKLIITDIVLAGDNALVIALAARGLPPKQQFWARMFGAGGAVGLRVLFVMIIAWLLRIPFLQLAGGLVLLWIAWKLVGPQKDAHHAAAAPVPAPAPTNPVEPYEPPKSDVTPPDGARTATSLREAIWMIVLADIAMSFDNVVAISNIAEGNIPLVIFGLALSIPLVVWGSSLIAALMSRHRWIIWLGGAVLGEVAGTILLKDDKVRAWLGPETTMIMLRYVPWVLAVVFFIYGWWSARAAARTPAKPA